jgi:leucyl-tRNA synthetase
MTCLRLTLDSDHPLTGKELPVYIAEYVQLAVGPNARLGIPGHNRWDLRFAQNANIPIEVVINTRDDENVKKQVPPVTDRGELTGAGEYSSWTSEDAIAAFESKLNAEGTTEYRLRDWLVSRDRYWGTPIPLINCDTCGVVPVPETELPVELPITDPGGTTHLHDATEWKQTNCPSCGDSAEREPRTLDPLFDSAWYFLRAISPQIATAPFEMTQVSAWMNVDLYVGTVNSTIIHIVYARALTKALRDIGLLDGVDEPFEKLLSQAVIKREGQKMSKSRGNIISAVQTIESYGADTVRFYILGSANPGTELSWTPSELDSVHQYLSGVFDFVNQLANDGTSYGSSPEASSFIEDEIDATITQTREAYDNQEFQAVVTEIRSLFSLLRRYESAVTPNQRTLLRGVRSFLHLLFPIAPHVAEELWSRLNHNNLLATASLSDPSVPENYESSRHFITNIQEDCRNINNLTNSDHTDWIEITLAPEWKYSLIDQIQDASEGEGRKIATDFVEENAELLGQEGAHQLVSNIDWDRVTGLTQEEEITALRSASWLLKDEFETDIRIHTLHDTDREPTKPPHPGRPAIYFKQ